MIQKEEKCRTSAGLFEVLSKNIKTQHNETIDSVQYCKLEREQKENAEEWMGYLRLQANGSGYKKKTEDKEKFRNGISDEEMIT